MPGSGHQDRQQRGRPEPRRPGERTARTGGAARAAPEDRLRHRRRPAALAGQPHRGGPLAGPPGHRSAAGRQAGHRQRLSRRLGDREPRWTAGADIVVCPRVTDASLVVGPAAWWHGWERDGLRSAGRCGRGGPHHRVRAAGDRRQLLVPGGGPRPPLSRLPDRRGGARRQQRDHQARRHRRRGQRRHRDRATALRDRGTRLREPGRGRPLRHHPRSSRTAPDRVRVSGTWAARRPRRRRSR